MRTSEELYHRVRWDPRFDPARFVLGITMRGREPTRVALPAFVPGGDIPWHRVVFIEADGEVVWDRASGIDRIDCSLAGRVRIARLLCAPFFTARTPHAWDPLDGWVPAITPGAGHDAPPTQVRVLTWNTLWDRYDSDRIDTVRRRPLLLAALASAGADVIALQEVERGFLTLLLSTDWVRENYTVDCDPADRDVDTSGVVLLSRLPVREAGRHTFGPHKAVSAITVAGAGGPIVVAAVHLTSDHTEQGAARRDVELARLAEGLSGVDGQVIVVGDFNDGSDLPAARLGLRDAWIEVHGANDPTVTFDPVRNPLAAVSSLTGRASRLDRVLLRAGPARTESPGSESVRVTGAALIGDVPVAGLFASDHYGVVVDIVVDPDVAEPVIPSTPEDSQAADRLTRTIASALPDGVVQLVGSRRLGCALAGADVDLVAAVPGAVDLTALQTRIAAALPAASIRPVIGARVPGLRMTCDAQEVDLVVVGSGPIPPAQAVVRRAELGEAAAIALSAVTDADAIGQFVGAAPRFAEFARAIKAWARSRGLDSAPFGGVPGLAWTVLAARMFSKDSDAAGLPTAELLHHFFGTWAAWDWSRPVSLTGQAAQVSAPMTILTPSSPVRSFTERVGPGMRDLVTDELYQAWEGRDPIPPHRRHAAWAVLTLRAVSGEAFEVTVGRLRGRVRSLLTAIEDGGAPDAHAWPRPFESGPELRRYAIGLGRQPCDARRLAELADGWAARVPGVRVDWADGGEIPALH